MTDVPPILPDDTPHRVQRFARLHGLSIVVFCSLVAIAMALGKSTASALCCVVATGAGMLEIHGANLVRGGDAGGVRWLIRAELLLLATIWVFSLYRLFHTDLTEMRAAFHASLEFPGMHERWAEAQRQGLTEDLYVLIVYRMTYIAMMAATLFYQGGLALYYEVKQKRIVRALSEE